MTVSKVLRKLPGVSPELREKILTIAHELGYRPNPLISALMSNLRSRRVRPSTQTGTVLAFVKRVDGRSDVRNEHFAGASKAAEELGYKLEPFIIGKSGLRPERLNNVLSARNIFGVLIAPLAEGHGSFELNWPEFCTVTIEYTFVQPTFDRVVHDSYTSMRLIMSKCRELGLRRVGLLLTQNGHIRTENLNDAAYWTEQRADHFFACIPPLYIENWNEATVSAWLDRHRLDVLITSEMLFHAVRNLLSKTTIEALRSVKILHINSRESRISGIRQNNEFIGATAVRLLIDKMNRNDRGIPAIAQTILIPGEWNPGVDFAVSD